MDYDDNDFQSQSLHLAGEGSNKYPPVSQSYSLPKFDFDDNLHGHLRYDSLVGTETFLGIESNEDNQWIEDFSQDNNSIVFSSSAAEPCAISRHSNVWSEATSSESVEMLLKSVGQDELVPRQNILKESDDCDELGCIIKQMEPSPKHEKTSSSKVKEAILQPALLQEEHPVTLSGSQEIVGGDQPVTKDASQRDEGGSSVDGSFQNMDPNPVGEVGDINLIQGTVFGDVECAVVEQSVVDQTLDETVGCSREGDSSATNAHDVTIDFPMQSFSAGNSSLNSQVALPMKNEIFDRLQNKSGKYVECHVSIAEQINGPRDCESLVLTGTHLLESMKEKNLSDAKESSDMILKEGSVRHLMDGCGGSVSSVNPPLASEHTARLLFKDSECVDQSKEDDNSASPGAFGQNMEVHNINAGTCFSVAEPKTDFVVQVTSGQSSFVEKDMLQSDFKLSPLEDDRALKAKVDSISTSNSYEISSSVSNEGISSPGPHGETHVHVISEGAAVCGGDEIRTVENNLVFLSSDIPNEDVSVRSKECTSLSSHRSNTDGKVGNVPASKSSPIHDNDSDKELIDPKIESDTKAGEKAALDAALGDVDLGSCDTADDLGLPIELDGALGAVTNQQEARKSTLHLVGFTSSDKELLPEKVDQSISAVDISSPCSQIKPETVHDEVSEDMPANVEADGVSEFIVKETDGDGVQALLGKHEEVDVEEAHEKAVSENAGSSKIDITGELILLGKDQLPARLSTQPLEVSCKDTGQNSPHGIDFTLAVKDKNPDKNPVKIAASSTSSDDFKAGGSHSPFPSSGLDVKSQVLESGSATIDNPFFSPIAIKTCEFPLNESGKMGVKNLRDQNTQVSMSIDPQDPKRSDASNCEKSFTFKVPHSAEFSEKEAGKNWQPFATLQVNKQSEAVHGPDSTSGLVNMDTRTSQDATQDTTHEGMQVSKGTPERKTRRTPSKSTGKESTKKGNVAKSTIHPKASQSRERKSKVPPSLSGIGQLAQSNEMPRYGRADSSSKKPFGVFPTSASSLPDLNSSASTSTVYQPPFTDLQQVQLRAQIFVYGALIQGSAPEEAYMFSAFGGADGGKSIWEKPFRACIERLHSQNLHHNNPETPLQPRIGSRATPDQSTKPTAPLSKGTFPPVGRASSKAGPTIVSPLMPISSPIWNIPTPCDSLPSSGVPRGAVVDYQPVLSPIHSHQTPPIKNFVGHTPSWMSPTPFRSPWAAPVQTSSFDTPGRFSTFPITESVRLTPVKEQTLPQSSSGKHISQNPVSKCGSPAGAIVGPPLLEQKKATIPSALLSTEPKARKRKKLIDSQEAEQNIFHSQAQSEPIVASAVISHPSATVSISTPINLVARASSEKTFLSPPPLNLSHQQTKEDQESASAEQRAILPEETLGKLKDASVHAEEAAALAAIAISHSQELWNQMDNQKNRGLEPDVETRLCSAAVAIAAAAAVAKAAAAAAKVASNAALQAKMMAEDAIASRGHGTDQGNDICTPTSVRTLARATTASILKGENAANSSTSAIFAAKEAARRRVEAATAASKHAENMDMIIKAAELAAEAVSQAGKIVAMGNPLPLRELVEAGPDEYWKVPCAPPELVGKPNDSNINQYNLVSVKGSLDTSAKHLEQIDSEKKETEGTKQDIPKELEDHENLVDCISGSIRSSEKSIKGRSECIKGLDLAKNIANSEADSASKLSSDAQSEKVTETPNENEIREGSHVEVFKDGAGFKTAWYYANVLSVKGGKAYVSYDELSSEIGMEGLEEWVTIFDEGGKAPTVRSARPTTVLPFEGTRKRRRAAIVDYTWSIGDRVDAWIQDSWWEGVITEKGKKDETTLNVHFPAQGETSAVRAWHLRPSLSWKDGKWIEWSSSTENNCSPHEGDTPNEKRQRLKSPAAEVKGKSMIPKISESEKPKDSGFLDLSTSQKTFNIGKSTRAENKPDSLGTMRTGLKKEGSRVVFGVPKPGKKRKFMEVSKHYVAEQSRKTKEPNEPVKFAKYLMPQTSTSRGLKSTFKSEPKEKQVTLPKSRIARPGKQQSVSGRTIPQKDELLRTAVSASDDEATMDDSATIKDSISTSGKQNLRMFQSSHNEGEAEGPSVSSGAPSSKKVPTSNTKFERASKGRLAPAGGKLAKIEEHKVLSSTSAKPASETVEQPRRSNRRIQPTSRLLEGLQSSLIVSKIPSVSHDRGHKNQNSQNRSTPRGNTRG